MFKYLAQKIDIDALKKYGIKHVISCEQHDQDVLLEIHISNEDGFGWTEGEGLLPDLLPLYDEIKAENHQFLRLASVINNEFTGKKPGSLSTFISETKLSSAQQAFLESLDIDYKVT